MAKLSKLYLSWLQQIKERIRSAQIKAAVRVNAELLNLYWQLGKEIIEKEKEAKWGNKLIEQLSKDLLKEFPEIKGFSRTNLFYIRKWYLFYNTTEIIPQLVGQSKRIGQQTVVQILPQLVGQIPCGHHREIITQCKDLNEAIYYISQAAQHDCDRSFELGITIIQMEDKVDSSSQFCFYFFKYRRVLS